MALLLAMPALLALGASCGNNSSAPPPPAAPGPPAAASGSAAPAPAPGFTVTSGSAIALSADGATLFVADEDHLAVLAVPASLHADASRVVPTPGPPAQIVASAGLVLVTVRSLPTDDARAAHEAIAGKPLQASEITRLPSERLPRSANSSWRRRRHVESEYRSMLDPSVEALADKTAETKPAPAPTAMPTSAPTAMPTSRPRAKPKPAPSAGAAPHPSRATPAAPIDAGVLRKSQGGLLLAYRPDPERGLVEVSRTVVAPDAWGVGATPDGKRAVVTSAWSSQVAVVDLATGKVVFTADVPREPRAVAVSADGKTAFVTHLVGTDLTEIEDVDTTPHIRAQALPAGPARTPIGATLSASLAYSAVLSPDSRTLYVPRHAIGAEGVGAWWGSPVVDTLDVRSGKALTPARKPGSPASHMGDGLVRPAADWQAHAGQPTAPPNVLVQPRAAVYRKKTDSLLIASEGWDTLTEVDALAADPSMAVIESYDLGSAYDSFGDFVVRGGAPSAVALSSDEDTAYVYCKSTFDLVKVDLTSRKSEWLRLAADALPGDAARGRRLFASARSDILSGGIGCAGCHPEGRDDGYVWREGAIALFEQKAHRFVGLRANLKPHDGWQQKDAKDEPVKLFPRQTPMIAGRVNSPGPYGWHAESPTLPNRIGLGFGLHRAGWDSDYSPDDGTMLARLDYLMDYLRSGLLPPPTLARELSPVEARGKAVFESEATKCASCHKPDLGYTDRTAYPLPALAVRFGFDDEEDHAFKTPSLRFLAGTGPYFHDGSAATLEDLVRNNGNRMGATLALSADDKAALVAYLKTL